jgi:hypothetical protein
VKGPVTIPEGRETGDDNPPQGDQGEANVQLLAGLGLGVYAIAGLTVLGSVCPLCIVASPVLLGAGLVNRHRAAKRDRKP